MSFHALNALTGEEIGDLKGVGSISEIRKRVADALGEDAGHVLLMKEEDCLLLEDTLEWPSLEVPLDFVSRVLVYVQHPEQEDEEESVAKTSRDFMRLVSGDADVVAETEAFFAQEYRLRFGKQVEGWTPADVAKVRHIRGWDKSEARYLQVVIDHVTVEAGQLVVGQLILCKSRPCEVSQVFVMPRMFPSEWPASVRGQFPHAVAFKTRAYLRCADEERHLHESVRVESVAVDIFTGEVYTKKVLLTEDDPVAKVEHSEYLLMDADDHTGLMSVLLDENTGECREGLDLPRVDREADMFLRKGILEAFERTGCVTVQLASWSEEVKVVGFSVPEA